VSGGDEGRLRLGQVPGRGVGEPVEPVQPGVDARELVGHSGPVVDGPVLEGGDGVAGADVGVLVVGGQVRVERPGRGRLRDDVATEDPEADRGTVGVAAAAQRAVVAGRVPDLEQVPAGVDGDVAAAVGTEDHRAVQGDLPGRVDVEGDVELEGGVGDDPPARDGA